MANYLKKQKNFWDSHNTGKDKLDRVVSMGLNPHMNQYFDKVHKSTIKKFVKFHKDMRVLDIGCGNGRLANWVAPFVGEVVGIDISERMINEAREICTYDNTEFYNKTIDELGEDTNNYFDLALCIGVLKYVEDDGDLEDMIEGVSAKLRSNGKVIVIDSTNVIDNRNAVVEDNSMISVFRPSTAYITLFEKNNFKLIKTMSTRLEWSIYNRYISRYERYLGSIMKKIRLYDAGFIVITKLMFVTDLLFRERLNGHENFFVFTKKGE